MSYVPREGDIHVLCRNDSGTITSFLLIRPNVSLHGDRDGRWVCLYHNGKRQINTLVCRSRHVGAWTRQIFRQGIEILIQLEPMTPNVSG